MAAPHSSLAELLEAHGVTKKPGDEGTVAPGCPHFGVCGGCQLQHLSYPDQLAYKHGLVSRAFASHGLDPGLVHPVLGAEDPWGYRNKVDLTAKTFGGEVHLGLLPHGEKHTLVEMDSCPIADPSINEVLQGIRSALPRHPEFRKRLISIVCRSSRAQKAVGLVFHGKVEEPQPYRDLALDIMGETSTVVGGVFVRKRKEHVTGDRSLKETVRGRQYAFPLRSFFQNNPPQTEALVGLVEELAAPTREDVVVDLYSGVGLFGLAIAEKVREVYLLEDTPYSAEAAQQNAADLGLSNVHPLRGQAEERLELMRRSGQKPSLVILDPPRSGCHENVVKTLTAFLERPRLVYVSCNAETHARDAARLVEGGYRLEGVWPVDMFPQTLHVEAVAVFR